ncbi:MAG TPA: IclR family transcriptional regulator [Pseudonocardiaceae bacterium]|jgi:DNA-binding IclR family transcriptional regulator|nr:IclR family transcriptional regulator [Pseudonocardiaceae bacterium]
MPRAGSTVSTTETDFELSEVNGSKTVAAVERAADVLLYFVRADSATLGVTDIATALSLSKAAVHRLLASLRTRNLVVLDERTRRYSLGPSALVLGLSALDRLDVRRLAAVELASICADTEETATLSMRVGESRVYVDQVTPKREVIMSVTIGRPFPLHAGASSKAFLAFLPQEEIDHYLAQSLPKVTKSTITDRRALARELREIADRGWARSIEERQTGAASVAAPVLDHTGRPAAVLSVCGPADRFQPEAETCAARLLQTTRDLSTRLGYRS